MRLGLSSTSESLPPLLTVVRNFARLTFRNTNVSKTLALYRQVYVIQLCEPVEFHVLNKLIIVQD